MGLQFKNKEQEHLRRIYKKQRREATKRIMLGIYFDMDRNLYIRLKRCGTSSMTKKRCNKRFRKIGKYQKSKKECDCPAFQKGFPHKKITQFWNELY